MRFAESVRAIISQKLLPRKNDDGRVPAVEILIATPAIRECLKDSQQMSQLKRMMSDGRKDLGSQAYEQHWEDLIETGHISEGTRRLALPRPDVAALPRADVAALPPPDVKTTTVSYGRHGPGRAASR